MVRGAVVVDGASAAERVRRPADLLLAVFAFAVVAVVLGTIRTLPLGSTEAADDVSRWPLHIPRWLPIPVGWVGYLVLQRRGVL